MSVVASTSVTDEAPNIPYGQYVARTIRVTGSLADNAADEWIATGLSEVIGILGGPYILGATSNLAMFNFVLNGEGTADTEDDVMGALGIESDIAVTEDFLITVFGRV